VNPARAVALHKRSSKEKGGVGKEPTQTKKKKKGKKNKEIEKRKERVLFAAAEWGGRLASTPPTQTVKT